MDKIGNYLPVSKRGLRSQAEEPQAQEALGVDVIDALWIGMADVYGHKWTSAYGADPAAGAGSTWATGLCGLTSGQVSDGMQACIVSSNPWPPTLPEFRGMCLGVPSFAQVRTDNGHPRHRFTVLCWRYLDGYAYRQASQERADRMLHDAYELAREHVMRGGSLPEVAESMIEQERPRPKPASPESVKSAMQRIRDILHEGDTEQPDDKPRDGKSKAAGDSDD